MIHSISAMRACHVGVVIALSLAVCACVTAPVAAPAAMALVVGEEAKLRGEVLRVDTAPWAYDGNAIVTLSTATGRVDVQLPARLNLCKAAAPADLQALQPGDRVQVIGTVTAPGEVVVCAQPAHRLQKLD